MKLKTLKLLTLIIGLTLIACNSNTEEVKVTQVTELEVSGMTCEHACGSTIKKNLAGMPGVDSVALDFNADRDHNFFKVYYNANAVTPQELKDKVNGIADGKLYDVVNTKELKNTSKETKASVKSNDSSTKVALNQRLFDGIINSLSQSVLQFTSL